MWDYCVNLVIQDVVCNNCFKDSRSSSEKVCDSTQVIQLQCNYLLNVIDIQKTYFTVLIQNGIQTIIRNISTSYETQICLPNKCVKHLLSISGSIVNK